MPPRPSGYPLIAEHGIIGDLQTAALVSTDGSIDWFCAPRFDSPSIFGGLLDKDKGGRFRIAATGQQTIQQLYFPDTAVLVTRFLSDEGVGELIDFMPIAGATATDRHRIVRIARCVRGEVPFVVEVAPRFDYGRATHTTTAYDEGAVFESADAAFTLNVVGTPGTDARSRTRIDDRGDLHVEGVLTAGQMRGVVLETGTTKPQRMDATAVETMFEQTIDFWKRWVDRSTYKGRWREAVNRSAITLKLMTYAPSGGLVAAPTAGLPEQVGGERNWDYRYTWIRDASFSVYSLLGLGYTEEAVALGAWIRDRIVEGGGEGSTTPLQIMYRIDGSSDLVEEELDHWEGYRGSRPVRIGNGAADQLQLDIYGEAMDSAYAATRHGVRGGHRGWTQVVRMLNWVADNWDQPEEGIWETRGGRQDFTYGRVMNWTALDRGIRLAQETGRPAPLERWTRERDAIYEQIFERGWSDDRQAFRQHYASEVLDSALLRMPVVGIVSPTDPMWLSTLDAMAGELVTDSLVYRYDPEASPDGLRGSEGTFSLCTFAYVNALARAGRIREARLTFEKMLTYSNHVGLFSEEIALNGEQIGNFPQAFTHLALIDAALVLDDALDKPHDATAKTEAAIPRQRLEHSTDTTTPAAKE